MYSYKCLNESELNSIVGGINDHASATAFQRAYTPNYQSLMDALVVTRSDYKLQSTKSTSSWDSLYTSAIRLEIV